MFGLQITVGSVVFYPVALRLTIQASKEKVDSKTQKLRTRRIEATTFDILPTTPERIISRRNFSVDGEFLTSRQPQDKM
ncbi:MAG: hypothetical protein IJ685_08960 [Selenomonadaceae bacterium]|nr:hypothetical protein [Selenomonadaceae bacterium]